VRALSNGESVQEEVHRHWPEHTSIFEDNLNRLNSLRRALSYYNGETAYDLLSQQDKAQAFWYRNAADTLGYFKHDIRELENLVGY
jgi:hypothetical protein